MNKEQFGKIYSRFKKNEININETISMLNELDFSQGLEFKKNLLTCNIGRFLSEHCPIILEWIPQVLDYSKASDFKWLKNSPLPFETKKNIRDKIIEARKKEERNCGILKEYLGTPLMVDYYENIFIKFLQYPESKERDESLLYYLSYLNVQFINDCNWKTLYDIFKIKYNKISFDYKAENIENIMNIISIFNKRITISDQDKKYLYKFDFYNAVNNVCYGNNTKGFFSFINQKQINLSDAIQFFIEAVTDENITISNELKDQLDSYQMMLKLTKK